MKIHSLQLPPNRSPNRADASTRSRLAVLNEKLTVLEKQLEFIEAKVRPPSVSLQMTRPQVTKKREATSAV